VEGERGLVGVDSVVEIWLRVLSAMVASLWGDCFFEHWNFAVLWLGSCVRKNMVLSLVDEAEMRGKLVLQG
jgi:hypothetical protein